MSSRIVSIISLLLCIFLVIFYRPAMAAARNGFELWATSVMPALFPFMVCTAIIQRLGCFGQGLEKQVSSKFRTSIASVLHVLHFRRSVGCSAVGAVFWRSLSRPQRLHRTLRLLQHGKPHVYSRNALRLYA